MLFRLPLGGAVHPAALGNEDQKTFVWAVQAHDTRDFAMNVLALARIDWLHGRDKDEKERHKP